MKISRLRFTVGSALAVTGLVAAGPARAGQFSWKWGVDLGPEHPICVRSVEAFH